MKKQEIVDKINDYLEHRISDRDLDGWATERLAELEDEELYIENFLIGDALCPLCMLHDEDVRFRTSTEEIEEIREKLLGRKEHTINIVIFNDFRPKAEKLATDLKKILDTLEAQEKDIDAQAFLDGTALCDRNSVRGILISQAREIIRILDANKGRNGKHSSARTLKSSLLIGVKVGNTDRLSFKGLIIKLNNIYECLTGTRELFVTIQRTPAPDGHFTHVVICS